MGILIDILGWVTLCVIVLGVVLGLIEWIIWKIR